MNIESLKILLDHKVSQHEINQSDWYKGFYKDTYLKKEIEDKEKIIQVQEQQFQQLIVLQNTIDYITRVREPTQGC